MHAPPRRARLVRRASIAMALGCLLAVLPLPSFSFVEDSTGLFALFPTVETAGAAEVDQMRGAVEGDLVEDRVIGSEPAVEQFSMIGLALDEAPSEPVTVRVREADGSWSEWIELEYSSDNGPDPDSAEPVATTTEPVWVGDATGYEISVADGDQVGARVALVREQTRRVVTDSVPMADAAPAPFTIMPRSSWNVRSTSTSSAGSLKMAVVHHTASSNNYSSAQVPGIIRSMQAYHMDNNGWSDLGYNFIVDKFGTIWEGRGGGVSNAVVGAHAQGFNTGSVGVSVIGNYVGASPTSASMEGVARIIGWRLQAYGVDPRSWAHITSGGSNTIPAGRVVHMPVVVGHRDVGATSCPGAIYGSLTFIRNRARNWYDLVSAMSDPVGRVDGITAGKGVITTSGWAVDPDSKNPIQAIMIVRGQWHRVWANRPRADWASHYASYGNDHGFAIGVNVPPGQYSVCVVALNVGDGKDTFLRCDDVVVK